MPVHHVTINANGDPPYMYSGRGKTLETTVGDIGNSILGEACYQPPIDYHIEQWHEHDKHDFWVKTFNLGDYTIASRWRVMKEIDRTILAIDIPGVRPNDLDVVIDNCVVVVNAVRFDTKERVNHVYTLHEVHDLDTVDATLDSGVLTITVQKFPERPSKKVHVKFG